MKKIISTGLSFTLLLSSTFLSTTLANYEDKSLNEKIIITESVTHDKYNVPGFVSGKLSLPSKESTEKIVKNYMGSKNHKHNFVVRKKFKNQQNQTIIKTQQTYDGIKVKDTEQVYIIDKDGVIQSVSGVNIPDIDVNVEEEFKIKQKEAYNIVKNDLKRDFGKSDLSNIEKVIIPDNEEAICAYSVKASFAYPYVESWEYIVDASTGKIIDKKDCLIYESVNVDGKTVFGNTISLNGYKGTIPDVNIVPEFSYSLADLSKTPPSGAVAKPFKLLTYELTSTAPINDFGNNLDGFRKIASDNDGHFTETASKFHAVDAHYSASKVYDFYKNKFGRYSYDNNGSNIVSNVHAFFKYGDGSIDSNNACFDTESKNIFYGDGDGTELFGIAGEIETIGHEFTHAVIDNESLLNYFGQSGSIHEGLADLFGEALESYAYGTNPDWKKMVKSYTPNISGDYYLDYKNPATTKFPDHMENAYNGGGDYLGVHTNASILTKAFSLMVEGGSFHNVNVTGIGLEKVTNLMYKVITDYLTSSTNFKEFAEASLNAASSLYGTNSTEYNSIKSGFQAVGIINGTSQWEKIGASPFHIVANTYGASQINDKIYVVGGQINYDDLISDKTWEYNLTSDQWTQKQNTLSPRRQPKTVTANGKIYTLFGSTSTADSTFLTSVDEYNPTTNQWRTVTNIPQKSIINLAPYPAGTVTSANLGIIDTWLELKTYNLSAGSSVDIILQVSDNNINFTDYGTLSTVSTSNTTVKFNTLNTNKKYNRIKAVVRGTSCPFELISYNFRKNSSVVSFNNKIYIIGGINRYGDVINTMDIYDISTNQWTKDQKGLTYGRTNASSILVTVNNLPKIYTLFGTFDGTYVKNIEVYDINSGSWSTLSNKVPDTLNIFQPSTFVYNGKLHFVGGCKFLNPPQFRNPILGNGATIIYDPVTATWNTNFIPGVTSFSGMCAVYNNNIYSMGCSVLNDSLGTSKIEIQKYEPVKINSLINSNAFIINWSKFGNTSTTLTIDGSTLYTGTESSYKYTSFINTSKKHLIRVCQNHSLYGNTYSKYLCTSYQKLGDLNQDNLINQSDVTLLYNYLFNNSTLSNIQKIAADTNMDNIVDSADYTMLSNNVKNGKIYPHIGTINLVIYGDVNNDGAINIEDYRVISSGNTLTTKQTVAADVNNDGVVNSTDSNSIKDYINNNDVIFSVMN